MRAPFVLGGVLALVLTLPAAAAAHDDGDSLLRVVSPTHGEGVHGDGVRVKVVVRNGATVRLSIGGRDVTTRLADRSSRRGPRMRTLTGRLPQSALGRSRTPVLAVTARSGRVRDTDHVLLHRVTRRSGFLRLTLQRDGRRAPVEAIVRTGAHRIWLRATLNGRRIEGVSVARRLGERRLRLTRLEGLRPGRNVLVVAANDANGRGDVQRRVFRLPRGAVIPGVRHPGAVRMRKTVVLDAGRTLAPRGSGLRYRWRFAAKPRGSRARLVGTGRRVARFRPDRPGRYSVRLVARATRRAGARRPAARRGRPLAAAAQATTSSGTLVSDVVVQAQVPPYGIPLQTDPAQGLTYGSTTIPMPGGNTGGMLLVTIDSSSGTVTQTTPIPGAFTEFPGQAGYGHDIGTLIDQLMALDDPDAIVIVIGAAGLFAQAWYGGEDIALIASLLSRFGVGDDAADDLAEAIVQGQPFALLGSPGAADGTATYNASSGSAQAGVLSGRLRLTGLTESLTGALEFEQPDYRLFRLGGGTGPTVVSELNAPSGSTFYNWIDQPLSGYDLMQVTVIDAVTLTTTASAVGVDTQVTTDFTAVATLLQQYAGDESKLILFKMSSPNAYWESRQDVSSISRTLAALGGNRDIFIRSLRLGQGGETVYPGADYVFFGGAGVGVPVEGSALITSSAPDGTPVQMSSTTASGLLRRDNAGQWKPVASRPSDAVGEPLQALATRAPVAYAYPTGVVAGTQAQYAAAEGALFQLLVDRGVVCAPGPDCGVPTGIRVNYANQELLENLSLAQTALSCSGGSVAAAAGASYTQAQLNALQQQICSELASLALVHDKLFAQMRAVYDALETDSSLDLLSASDSYLGFLQDERDKQLQPRKDWLGLGGDVGEVAGDIVNEATQVAGFILAPETGGASLAGAEAIGDFLTLAGDTVALADAAKNSAENSDKVAPTLITVGSLFTYLQSTYGFTSARLGEIEGLVMSDPTKLADAAAMVTGGKWDLEKLVNAEHQASELITFEHRAASLRYMLPRMLSAAAKACDVGGSSDDPTTYEAWTQLVSGEGDYLAGKAHRRRSVHVDSDDAQALAPKLFGAPFQPRTDPIASGPTGAALAPSPFFMWQIAPTSTAGGDCSDHF